MAGRNTFNHFISTLSEADRALVEPHLATVELHQGDVLQRQLEQISYVYFPLEGVVSLVVSLSDGQSVEAGMVGFNGAVGGGSALDGKRALNKAIVQGKGSAQRIQAETLRDLASRSASLRTALFSREQAINAHAQQVAACNAVHELEPRLARWMLQVRDLVKSNKFELTQEFDVSFDKPDVKRAKLQLEGRLVGLLRSHEKGGSAEASQGCVSVRCGDNALLSPATYRSYGALPDRIVRS